MSEPAVPEAQRRWLLEQLPALVADGVLDEAAAERLRRRYAATAPAMPWGLIISALIGTTLCGAGLILLLAHNWDAWNRATRTVLSFLPLLLTQALTLFALRRRAASVAWTESAALAQMAAIAASMALIGQTYHLPGDLGSFLLAVVLLSLPLVYLLRASVTALFCLASLTFWSTGPDAGAAGYLGLLALLLPHLADCLRRDRYSRRSRVLVAGVALSLAVVHLGAFDLRLQGWALGFGSLAALALLVDARFFAAAPAGQWRPLREYGRIGVAGVALLLTGGDSLRSTDGFTPAASGIELAAQALLACGPLAAALLLWALAWSRRRIEILLYGALPPLILLLQLIAAPALNLIAFNLYVLALGVVSIREGLRTQDARSVNFGLLVIVLLGGIRFLASDLPYWLRGIAFVLAGAGFLGANLWLKRRRA